MDSQNVPYPGEDLNVPAVSLEGEAWLMGQTANIDPPRYAVGARVVLTHSIKHDDINLRRGTLGTVQETRFEIDGMEWTYHVAWEGLRWEVLEEPDLPPIPNDEDGKALWFIQRVYGSRNAKVVGHSSIYIVVEQEIRHAFA